MLLNKIKNILMKLTVLILIITVLTGCEIYSRYTDPETGELVADVSRISLLKKSSVKTIYSTNTNVFFLMNNSTVLATGANNKMLLGQGNTNSYDYIVEVKLPERIKLITADESRAVAVSDTNYIYIWGDLSWWNSELLTTTASGFTYRGYKFPGIVVDISISSEHITVLLKDGTVYTLGYNKGQLGYDRNINQGAFYQDFRKVDVPDFITDIESSSSATYMLASNGSIYGASHNSNYELGYLDSVDDVNLITSYTEFDQITTAGANLIALSRSGDVYVCGANTSGVLGLNSTLSNAAALTKITFPENEKIISICGNNSDNTAYFITETNKLYATGTNTSGLLYTEDKSENVIFPSIVNVGAVAEFFGTGTAKFYIDTSRHLYTYGLNDYNQMPITDSSEAGTFISPIRIYASVK